jgi:hypothetical protein
MEYEREEAATFPQTITIQQHWMKLKEMGILT